MPDARRASPVPSRLISTRICVSRVLRSMRAVRAAIKGPGWLKRAQRIPRQWTNLNQRSIAPIKSGKSDRRQCRSEEHTSELQSLMRISYAVFCLKKKISPTDTLKHTHNSHTQQHINR